MPERQFTDADLSRLVTGRASRHLRQATIMLASTLVLVTGVLMFLEQQQGEVVDNFVENRNVHYVEVTARGDDGPGSGALLFSDLPKVADIADGAAAGGAEVTGRYGLSFGVVGPDDMSLFVTGITGDGDVLGVSGREAGGALATSALGTIDVEIPVVTVNEDGGMSSDELARTSLDVAALPADVPLRVFDTRLDQQVFVTEKDFAQIVGLAYGVGWDEFQREHDGGQNPYGITVVQSYFVHVDELDDVDAVAAALDAQGFATTYTLRAFDDLARTLATSIATGAVVALLVVLLCLVLTFTNLRSYLNLAHRDMGILQHVGYAPGQVVDIYRRRLLAVIGWASIPAVALLAVGAATVLRGRPLAVALDAGVLVLLVALVAGVVVGVQLPRHVRRPVLSLLKLERQFE